jgi:hypothetical protein
MRIKGLPESGIVNITAPTLDTAKEILKILDNHGFTWSSGDNLVTYGGYWDRKREDTVYGVNLDSIKDIWWYTNFDANTASGPTIQGSDFILDYYEGVSPYAVINRGELRIGALLTTVNNPYRRIAMNTSKGLIIVKHENPENIGYMASVVQFSVEITDLEINFKPKVDD